MARYQVYVGNIGIVEDTDEEAAALAAFNEYKSQSIAGYGRAAGEDVFLMEDGEPSREYYGDNDEEAGQ